MRTSGFECGIGLVLQILAAAASSCLTSDAQAIGDPSACIDVVSASLVATPAVVAQGQKATLQWSVTPTSACPVSGFAISGVGVVARSGSVQVTPQTDYPVWTLSGKIFGTTVALAAAGVTADTAGYTTSGTPMCTSAQIMRHDAVRADQHGVDVQDPDGYFIGTSEGDGELYRNWEPIDQYKHAFCGTQFSYGFFKAPWYAYNGDEADSNMIMVPVPAFRRLIDDPVALNITTLGNLHYCGGDACLEAEITPDENDASPWFPHSSAPSPLTGKNLCAYGPWVADHGHGGRPEIHPSEARWWPTVPAPSGLLDEARVLLMQDDSNRYDDRVNDFVPDMPASIKPWSASPRTAWVRYAFRVPQAGGTAQYLHIWNAPRYRYITTGQGDGYGVDVTAGVRHTLSFNGTPRFVVEEHPPELGGNLSVGFDDDLATAGLHDVCARTDGTLQGYVLMRTRFSINNSGGEGFQELVLRHSNIATDQPPALQAVATSQPMRVAQPKSVVGYRVDRQTLHLVKTPRGSRLSGDVLVTLSPGVLVESALSDAGDAIDVQTVHPGNTGNENIVRLVDVDVSNGRSLNMALSNGETMASELPSIGVGAGLQLQARRAKATRRDLAAAWRDVVTYVGGKATDMPSGFAYIAQWRASAVPWFTAMKDGEASEEDSDEIVEFLNEAAERGTPGSGSILADSIASVAWSDSSFTKADTQRWEHAVRFESAASLRSQEVSMKLSDAFGNQDAHQTVAYSHGIFDMTVAGQQALVAALAGIDVDLIRDPQQHDRDSAYSVLASKQRELEMQRTRSTRDGVVTPEEIKVQVRLAAEIAAKASRSRSSE